MALVEVGGGVSRRTLLIGGGAGVGLLLAWGLWPRHYEVNLRAGPGEQLFNAFLKIGRDGRVIVAVPQAEIGQGVYTSLPQIIADELGADWRTVSVEPAPISPLYANRLLAGEIGEEALPSALQGIGNWAAQQYATRSGLMLTGGSSSVRAFEQPLREAGAAARALLMQEAADRWNVDWNTLDAVGGFVVRGGDKLRFGELAEGAAQRSVPDHPPMRGGKLNRLAGQPLPRLDLPSKVDGSAQFAGDIRLRDMLFASVRQGPIGDSRLIETDKAAVGKVPGVLAVFEMPTWAGVVATNWWAANRAVEALAPVFETRGRLVDDAGIDGALAQAMDEGKARRTFGAGDMDAAFKGGRLFRSHYDAGAAPSAALEPLTATARITGDRLEIWAPAQAPALARGAAARAIGIGEDQVTLYRTFVGSGYGRKIETAAIEQTAVMAQRMKRPVQLTWSRIEETMQDGFRSPAMATMTARMEQDGRVTGWHARIAAQSAEAHVIARLRGDRGKAGGWEALAADGAVPPYAIPAVGVDVVPVETGLRLGLWRSGAHGYTVFFNECFIDELARQAKIEPLSFRMQMLTGNARLARVLSTAAALGGWDGGGPGSNMGLAAHSAFGSHAALLVEAEVGKDQRVRVLRAVCAVDCGDVINPEIVRQQIEGGIIYGIAGATGRPIQFEGGLSSARAIGDLGLPRLADSPEVSVEIINSDEAAGGVTELSVPLAAPAIANALFAATGQRLRSLPLVPGSA